jgi:serine/threonine protein kinase
VNNGVFMTWDEENQKYCKYFTSFGGDFRAPEEYAEDGAWVDEMVDIWPMGNMIYTLLVGLWPYYSEDDTRKIQKMSMMGIRPYLDARYRSRSLIERRMIEIMDQCHELKPEDRPQIFEVVLHLKETKRMHQAQQKLLLLEQEHKKKESPQEECSV